MQSGSGRLQLATWGSDVAEPTRETTRLDWLDGLRGLAAMQVVLLHYVTAFVPPPGMNGAAINQNPWWQDLVCAPLRFVYEGASAVYLFFIMSGVALTCAFTARPLAWQSAVVRRIIRLGLPMVVAVLFGAALFAVLPEAHVAAGEQSGSHWLSKLGPQSISVGSVVHQIALEGLLAGYRGWSLLPDWITQNLGLMPLERSFDAPLWTLHLEFCGSLLVLLLVAVRSRMSPMMHRTTCIVLGVMFMRSPLGLFILGHVAASHLWHGNRNTPRWPAFGAVLFAAGILLCTAKTFDAILAVQRFVLVPPLGLPGDGLTIQKMIGAAAVFGALGMLPVLQRSLTKPAMRWLGKISFSLYLTHIPLEFCLAAAGFNWLSLRLPYTLAVVVVSIVGIASSLAVATVFERWVDRPSVRLSRLVGASPAGAVRAAVLVSA